ncbi:MAG: hypothetical protein OEM32_04465 [Acidimicrobiia bacterium]|nr:hypothetical protein [Acidimicrobiia bacterium]
MGPPAIGADIYLAGVTGSAVLVRLFSCMSSVIDGQLDEGDLEHVYRSFV